MIDYLVCLSGDPPPDALRVMLIKSPAVYGEPGEDGLPELLEPEERLAGDWAIVFGGAGIDLWSAPDTVAEIRRADSAVLRTRDEAILGCLVPGISARGGLTRLERAAPDTTVPPSISDRQFAQILALDGVISEDEALAWAARGELPGAMETALSNIPEAGGLRFGAKMLLASATTYERAHPLVPTLGALLLYDAAALDDIWRRAAAL